MPDHGDARADDDRSDAPPHDPRAGGEPQHEPEVLPAEGPVAPRPVRARPGAQLAVRRGGAVPQIREQLARLARNPVAVTTALVGAGLAVRLAPAALGRELARSAALPAVRPVPVEPAVVRQVVHHVVHHTVHVVVHVRPSPPPSVL